MDPYYQYYYDDERSIRGLLSDERYYDGDEYDEYDEYCRHYYYHEEVDQEEEETEDFLF